MASLPILFVGNNNNEIGHLDLVQLLVERGALLEHAGSDRKTPLYEACSKGVNLSINQ